MSKGVQVNGQKSNVQTPHTTNDIQTEHVITSNDTQTISLSNTEQLASLLDKETICHQGSHDMANESVNSFDESTTAVSGTEISVTRSRSESNNNKDAVSNVIITGSSLVTKSSIRTRSQMKDAQTNNYPLLASQRETSSHSSLSQNSYSSLVSNDIREVFDQFPHGITSNKFGKLVQSKNLKEVTVKGNGFCFLSCLLITLAEQGINKTVEVICVEIMTEIRNNLKYYEQFQNERDSDQFIRKCVRYLENGEYNDKAVDICIGATANALGVNLNIFQKDSKKKRVTLTRYDCNRIVSSVNIFLQYYPGSVKGKQLDAHFNCYVETDYYKKNTQAISSRMVTTENEVTTNNNTCTEAKPDAEQRYVCKHQLLLTYYIMYWSIFRKDQSLQVCIIRLS